MLKFTYGIMLSSYSERQRGWLAQLRNVGSIYFARLTIEDFNDKDDVRSNGRYTDGDNGSGPCNFPGSRGSKSFAVRGQLLPIDRTRHTGGVPLSRPWIW